MRLREATIVPASPNRRFAPDGDDDFIGDTRETTPNRPKGVNNNAVNRTVDNSVVDAYRLSPNTALGDP